jgi:hypothetical protein
MHMKWDLLDPVPVSCVRGNKRSKFIQCEKFFHHSSDYQHLKKSSALRNQMCTLYILQTVPSGSSYTQSMFGKTHNMQSKEQVTSFAVYSHDTGGSFMARPSIIPLQIINKNCIIKILHLGIQITETIFSNYYTRQQSASRKTLRNVLNTNHICQRGVWHFNDFAEPT